MRVRTRSVTRGLRSSSRDYGAGAAGEGAMNDEDDRLLRDQPDGTEEAGGWEVLRLDLAVASPSDADRLFKRLPFRRRELGGDVVAPEIGAVDPGPVAAGHERVAAREPARRLPRRAERPSVQPDLRGLVDGAEVERPLGIFRALRQLERSGVTAPAAERAALGQLVPRAEPSQP